MLESGPGPPGFESYRTLFLSNPHHIPILTKFEAIRTRDFAVYVGHVCQMYATCKFPCLHYWVDPTAQWGLHGVMLKLGAATARPHPGRRSPTARRANPAPFLLLSPPPLPVLASPPNEAPDGNEPFIILSSWATGLKACVGSSFAACCSSVPVSRPPLSAACAAHSDVFYDRQFLEERY